MKDRLRGYMTQKQQQQHDEQDKQLENFTPVGRGGWLTFATFITAIGLGISNGYLFIATIGGWYGYVIAATAVCLEITALYCVLNYVRSRGEHKEWLGRFGTLLGGFSLIHAVFAIVHFSGYGRDNWFVEFYTNVLAFPIIMILLSVSVATLTRKHWSAALFEKIIGERIKGLSNRAEVLIEQDVLLNRAELAALKAKIFEIETMIKHELIPVIRQRIDTEKEIERMLRGIGDRAIENEIRHEFEALKGTVGNLPVSNGSGNGLATRP